MSTSSKLPTLIFIHGAWHTSACFSRIIEPLRFLPNPYKCVAVDLPSVGSAEDSPARKSWQPDIEFVRDVISAELEGNNSVLLVSHSLGSVPSQNAVQEFGETGKMKQLIIAGFLLDEGDSMLGHNNGVVPPMWDIQVCGSRFSFSRSC